MRKILASFEVRKWRFSADMFAMEICNDITLDCLGSTESPICSKSKYEGLKFKGSTSDIFNQNVKVNVPASCNVRVKYLDISIEW